ncbi:MAG: hypothetical protein M3Z65_00760 [Chloroflexota bacterium]|nr:hypothetical protein [Chloroflexota bacterium]
MTPVTSRELETLLQLACFHYLTAAQVEGFLFDGSTLLPASRQRVARRILAGSVASAIGLAELLRAWLIAVPLPQGSTAVTTGLPMDQVVRGATLLVIGVAFWTVHFFLPRPALRGSDALYLVFVTVGAAAFGLATLVTLPVGVAGELQRVFGVTAPPRTEGTFGAGLAGLAFWLGHLWQLRAHLGHGRMLRVTRAYPRSPPPPAPAVVGAPLIRPPDTRSAGAAALPPPDR